jgi:hypothetical protein
MQENQEIPDAIRYFKFMLLSPRNKKKYKCERGVAGFKTLMPGEVVEVKCRGKIHKRRVGSLVFRDPRNNYSVYTASTIPGEE